VIADPFNVKPLLFPSGTVYESQSDGTSQSENGENIDSATGTPDKHPALTPSQEKALETFGIDPAAVPTEITPEQESCFIEILGEVRVGEIKAGDTPTATEFFRARGCIE
jgi:hypothetical protein